MHYPLPLGGTMVPQRVLAYYSGDVGMGTPSLSFVTSSTIGDVVTSITTGTPDTGQDYSVVGGTFPREGSGVSDLKVKFTFDTAAGGTVGHQRLYGTVLEGSKSRVRVGSV
jgi:hypothetical protein